MTSGQTFRLRNVPERGTARAKPSMRRVRTTVVVPTTVGTRQDIAGRFANHFADYSPAELSKHIRCTKEGARLLLNGERCISLEGALKLARSLPEGRYWLAQEAGEFDSPQLIAKLIAALQRGAQ